MVQVKIIRAALREIQKLPNEALKQVYNIIISLRDDQPITDTKFLSGYEKQQLRRTRKGKVRVVWTGDDSGDILVIKAGWRRDIYNGTLPNRDFGNQAPVTELLNPQEDPEVASAVESFSNNPTYQLQHDNDTDWYQFYQFVYGCYRYSPILTDEQYQVLDTPFEMLCSGDNSSKFEDRACVVFQSAPGTGKTVCATLFACKIHREFGWNTMLIVPEALHRDVAEYTEIKKIERNPNFWLGTFPDWINTLNPALYKLLASPQQELQALQAAAQFNLKTKINPDDVLIYQAFVIDKSKIAQNKNGIYKHYFHQICLLSKVKKKLWQQKLSGKLSRLEVAEYLKNNPPQPPQSSQCTIIIIDEAQDYLLNELQAVIALCKTWSETHPTYLWLLGDLNQRIQPTDFVWSQLNIKKQIQLHKNYRNSYFILDFANKFWQLAQHINSRDKCKQLPLPANPEYAFEKGDKVRLLVYEDAESALLFLRKLAEKSSLEDNRYLLRNLANSIKILTNQPLNSLENLVILNAEKAKGREFDACVAFCLFEGTGEPTLKETFQWYTMLTRARSRLLVVSTSAEINRLNSTGYNLFENCDRVEDVQQAINWIAELASDVDVSQISNDVTQYLLKSCSTGNLYWDSYLALELAGIEGDSLENWELQAIATLQKHHSRENLINLLGQTEKVEFQNNQIIPLRCLLLRSMQRSWDAVNLATQLKASDVKQYQRLILSIASDLEAKALPYEAARMRSLLGDKNYKPNLPFWDCINDDNRGLPLVSFLCETFISKLDNFMQSQERN